MLFVFSKNKIQTGSFIKYSSQNSVKIIKKKFIFKTSKIAFCLCKKFSYNEEEITTNILIHSQDVK